MPQPVQYEIQDKTVLTKTANMLSLSYDLNVETDIVGIHPNIYRLELPPSGQTEIPATKINVFFDDFYVKQSDLPGTGTLDEKVLLYVCNVWNLTII